jgi:hypothetical protein
MAIAKFGYIVIAEAADDGTLTTVAAFSLASDGAAVLAKETYDRIRWSEGETFFALNTATIPTTIDASDSEAELCGWENGAWHTLPLAPVSALWTSANLMTAARLVH